VTPNNSLYGVQLGQYGGAGGVIMLSNPGDSVNQKLWDICAYNGGIEFRSINDNNTNSLQYLNVTRNGIDIAYMTYGNLTDQAVTGHTWYGYGVLTSNNQFGTNFYLWNTYQGAAGANTNRWQIESDGYGGFEIAAQNDLLTTRNEAIRIDRANGTSNLTYIAYGNAADAPQHNFYGQANVTGNITASQFYYANGSQLSGATNKLTTSTSTGVYYLVGTSAASGSNQTPYANTNVYVQANSQMVAVDFASTSDATLKTVVQTLPDALARVQSLKGVSFHWNKEAAALGLSDTSPQVGLLAQDVQAVLPEAVFEVEVGRMKGKKLVSYDKLVPLLIEAIKELSAKVAALEAK
jgi:hypothetical protein